MNTRPRSTPCRILLLLTACVGGGALAPGSAAAQAQADAPETSGRILTLAQALRVARASQPTLTQAQGAVMAAEGQADVNRAPLLPQVNGSGTYTRATANFVAPAGSLPNSVPAGVTVSSLETAPFWRFGLTANQLLWDFGESLNRWRSAKVAADAQDQSLHVTEAQVAYNVRVAFFTARAAKELVGVAKDTLANLEKHLGQIEGFVQLGRNPEIDLTQARADRANGRVQLINAQNTYDVTRAQLNQAMGIERSTDYDLSDDGITAVDGEDQDVGALVDEAWKGRPEISNLRLLVQSQDLAVRSARDGHFPALSLSTGLTDAGPSLDRLTWNLTGALVLGVPIFQGGQINAQVRQNRGLLLQAQAQLEIEHQQVRLEVDQARLGVRAAKAVISAADDALANTRDRLRLAEGRYQTGVGSIIELGDAQVAQTAAAGQRVQAEYQLFTARAQLLKALGRN